MAYLKDSAVIVLRAGEDGYFAQVYHWGQSPPPSNIEAVLANVEGTGVPYETRQDRISADKTELKNEISAFVDNFFDT